MSLSSDQNRTIVMEQRAFHQEFKTFSQQTFTKMAKITAIFRQPTNANSWMYNEDDEIKRVTSTDLRKTTVADFLQEHYRTKNN